LAFLLKIGTRFVDEKFYQKRSEVSERSMVADQLLNVLNGKKIFSNLNVIKKFGKTFRQQILYRPNVRFCKIQFKVQKISEIKITCENRRQQNLYRFSPKNDYFYYFLLKIILLKSEFSSFLTILCKFDQI
jgi:hypothetical protein